MYHDHRGNKDEASPFEYCKLPDGHTLESYTTRIRNFEQTLKTSLVFVCDMDIVREIAGLSVKNLQLNSSDTVVDNRMDSKTQYVITSHGEEWFCRLSFYECQLIIAATLNHRPMFLQRLYEIAKHREGNLGMNKHAYPRTLLLRTMRHHGRQVIDNPDR